MKKIYKRTFARNDNKEMYLYGYNDHTEKPTKQLEVIPSSQPHLRWHESRE